MGISSPPPPSPVDLFAGCRQRAPSAGIFAGISCKILHNCLNGEGGVGGGGYFGDSLPLWKIPERKWMKDSRDWPGNLIKKFIVSALIAHLRHSCPFQTRT